MKRYAIPILRTRSRKARTKAMVVEPSRVGAKVYTLEAKSHADAARQLQERILPDDKRPIMGRTNVKLFIVSE